MPTTAGDGFVFWQMDVAHSAAHHVSSFGFGGRGASSLLEDGQHDPHTEQQEQKF